MKESGAISIHTENVMPIIKKWLYHERDIFIRELVSNAADALQKLEKISLVEDIKTETKEARIDINIDKPKKTITITDTGVGMTADEMKRYINQVAFSGVKDFVEKFEGKDDQDQIIGHFGLGFYSAFMVSECVEIDSLSYQDGAEAAHWQSTGDGQYEMAPSERKEVGTTITLHINEASADVLDVARLKQVVAKYCGFMKYDVYLQDELVSDTRPLWTQNASQLKDDDYKTFFQKVFPTAGEPLFWIHLNVDYPFKLRGILYFPKLAHELEASEGEVKLFCNQVYVEDNCKELIPEYLTLLKGVIDCPDLPLNVSRSALQVDAKVRKISQHITKKVADKLSSMYKTKREDYEKYWEDINPFVKYAMMRDSEFFDRMKEYVIYKSTDDSFVTIPEYLEKYKDQTEEKVLYVSDPHSQANFVKMIKSEGLEAIVANRVLDQHFLPYLEMQSGAKYKFQRIDADLSKMFVDSDKGSEIAGVDGKTNSEKIIDIFTKYLKDKELKVEVEALKNEHTPAVLIIDENMRRLKEMSRSGQMGAFAPNLMQSMKLVVNRENTAVKNLVSMSAISGKDQDLTMIVQQIYDLASLQQGQFDPKDMADFIERSTNLLSKLGTGSSIHV